MRTTIRFLLLFSLALQSHLPLNAESAQQSRRWQVEISGGLQWLSGRNLNSATEAENRYLDLYFRDSPDYQTIQAEPLKRLNHALTSQAGIKYRLGGHLTAGAGVCFLYGSSGNTGEFVFQRNEGWRVLTDSLDYQAFDTRLSMISPYLGLFLKYPLGSRLHIEVGVTAGPVFARVEQNRHIVDAIDVLESGGNQYRMYQDERSLTMKGRGTGIGAGAGLKLMRRLSPRLDLFLEMGYQFVHLPAIKGSSILLAGGIERRWEGEWFLVGENVEKNWGSADFRYPSNDPGMEPRRIDDFRINAYGFPMLRLGLCFML